VALIPDEIQLITRAAATVRGEENNPGGPAAARQLAELLAMGRAARITACGPAATVGRHAPGEPANRATDPAKNIGNQQGDPAA